MARRDHRSVFLYATEPVHLADIRAIGGLADDLRTGTLDLQVRVGFAAEPRRVAGRGDDRHGAGVELGAEAPATATSNGSGRGRKRTSWSATSSEATDRLPSEIDRWAELSRRLQPPRGLSRLEARDP